MIRYVLASREGHATCSQPAPKCMEGPPPLYTSYVNPEQTKLDRHQKTLEADLRERPMNQEANKNERKLAMKRGVHEYAVLILSH